jgi:hypothetical protein
MIEIAKRNGRNEEKPNKALGMRVTSAGTSRSRKSAAFMADTIPLPRGGASIPTAAA